MSFLFFLLPGTSDEAADLLLSPRLEWLLIGSWHIVYKHRDKGGEREREAARQIYSCSAHSTCLLLLKKKEKIHNPVLLVSTPTQQTWNLTDSRQD